MGWDHDQGAPDLEPARAAGRELASDLDMFAKLKPFEPHRWQTAHTGHPALHLDDVSGIPFLEDIVGVEEYQHRARVRAGDDDLFVTVTPPAEGYEAYCQDVLCMGRPLHLVANPDGPPIAVARASLGRSTMSRLAEAAMHGGGMTIHPYMGIEDVWELAAVLATDSQTQVTVVAPPPPVTWVANDKAVFHELVEQVLGSQWLPETRVARDADGIRHDLVALAQRHRRVGLKRTRCASAMGNAVFVSADLLSDERVAEHAVTAFLERTEWPHGEEVLSVAWLDAHSSPSSQLWIPPLGFGDPRVDGVYEQILEGDEKVFVGSRLSSLPHEVNHVIACAGLRLAAALQELGYAGRCSFDHLITGEPEAECDIVFMECNGRWGGTSTPMSMLDRLWGQAGRPPYRAQDVVLPSLAGAELKDLLRPLDDVLYRTETGEGRFMFYNVGPLHKAGKFDVISIGADQEDADYGVLELLPKRLHLS